MKIPKHINPKQFPFFYGYIILIVGAIGGIMSAPGQTVGVSVFTDHLIEALGLSRVSLSWTYMIGTTASAFLLTYGGKMYDKYGARVIAPIAGLGLGIFLVLLTSVDKIAKGIFNIVQAPISTITFALLIIGFLGIRFFGQGLLTMVSRNMVMKWFDKKRGLASAIFGISLVLGFSVAPKIFSSLINIYDWRITWQLTAIVVGVIFLFFSWVFFRDNPQKYGIKPDGNLVNKRQKKTPKRKKIIATGYDFELKDAIKTYSFWVFALSMTLFALYFTAFTFHIEDIFVSAGLSKEQAVSVFIPTAIVAVVFQLIGGWVADYVKLKYILYFSTSGLLISMIGAAFLKQGLTFWMIILGNSMAQGVFGILSSVTWPRFFGIKHLGAISGFAVSWVVAGSAIGPLLFSYSKNITSSYFSAFIICAIIAIALLIMAAKADNASEKKLAE